MNTLHEVRKACAEVLELPTAAKETVEAYLHIQVAGVAAPCPYHINAGVQATNTALVGKGSPHDIETLAAKYFKQYDMHPTSPEELRTFLQCCGIGVDCSGFAAHVLNAIAKEQLHKPIWKVLRFPGLRRSVVSKLRPVQNISANLLTGAYNARAIEDLCEIRPGDLLRVAGWHHVVVVTEVGVDAKGKAKYFAYAQSSCMYGTESGVRTGFAFITKPRGSLGAQQWFDGTKPNVIEGLIAEGESYAVRLKAFGRLS